MDSNKKTIIAIVLIIIAALIFAFQYQRTKEPPPKKVTAEDIKAEIQRIQNDPRMPPQAKAIAINQLAVSPGGGKGTSAATARQMRCLFKTRGLHPQAPCFSPCMGRVFLKTASPSGSTTSLVSPFQTMLATGADAPGLWERLCPSSPTGTPATSASGATATPTACASSHAAQA